MGSKTDVCNELSQRAYLSLYKTISLHSEHIAGRGFLTRRPPPPVLVTSLLFSDFVILQPPSTLFYFVSMTGHVIAAHILINFMMISL